MKILISIILIIFPILMYLVFSCYNELMDKRKAKLLFIFTIFTSLYFSLRIDLGSNLVLLFCNIPILICYLKKEPLLGLISSIVTITFGYYRYDINITILIVKHFLYFFTYIFFYNKKDFNSLYLKISAIIQGFFLSFEYFLNPENVIDKIFILILYTSVIYGITFFCLYLFQLADSITNLYIDMNNMREENKLKNSLFKLTHEIKNPLAVCKGYLDMINLEDATKTAKYINIIKSEIDRSLNIMNDFMDYSKIKINKELFDMGLLLDELNNSFNILLSEKKIDFKYENNYEDVYVNGDYNRLKQVFVNIIKNSIEAVQEKGVINLLLKLDNNKVIVIVRDNGIGMDEVEMENMNEMFYTTKKNGTGLGVALSREIVLAHDGNIQYKSEKNKGTECIVSLPL